MEVVLLALHTKVFPLEHPTLSRQVESVVRSAVAGSFVIHLFFIEHHRVHLGASLHGREPRVRLARVVPLHWVLSLALAHDLLRPLQVIAGVSLVHLP